MTIHDVLFYGVRTGDGAGHYLHAPGGGWARESDLPPPLRRIDCVWTRATPRTQEEVRDRIPQTEDQHQGRAFMHYVAGWTIVSWWDRSEDKRGACNANFLARGRRNFASMLALAREHFPREMRRMESAYALALAGEDIAEVTHAWQPTQTGATCAACGLCVVARMDVADGAPVASVHVADGDVFDETRYPCARVGRR